LSIRALPTAAALLALLTASPAGAYEEAIHSRAKQIAKSLAKQGVRSVVVVDFTDLDFRVHELGRFLAEELSVALAAERRDFRVIDRRHVHELLREQKLGSTGLVERESLSRLGRIAGAEAILTGTVTKFKDSLRLAVKVLDAETAELKLGVTANLAKTRALEELLDRQAEVEATAFAQRPPEGDPWTVEQGGVRYRLEGCSGKRVVECTFAATSLGMDRQGKLGPGSRAVDREGNEHLAAEAWIGDDRKKATENRLINGVPLKLVVEFRNFPKSLEGLAVVEIDTAGGPVRFADVPLYR
jgi:TolB-like protein